MTGPADTIREAVCLMTAWQNGESPEFPSVADWGKVLAALTELEQQLADDDEEIGRLEGALDQAHKDYDATKDDRDAYRKLSDEQAVEAGKWRERAVAAEADRDQWQEAARRRLERAEAAEAALADANRTIAELREQETEELLAAEADRDRLQAALVTVFLDPLTSHGARAFIRKTLGIEHVPFEEPAATIARAALDRHTKEQT